MLKICAPPRVLLCPRSNPPLHHWEETGKQEKGETILVPDSAAAIGTMTAVTKAIKVVAAAMAGASEGSWTPAPAASPRSSLSSTAVT